MIKLLHAADFHLDAAFASLPPELARQRREEQRRALSLLAKEAEGCELVLLSGDLFDGKRVYRDTLDALKACFAAIHAKIFIAPGNHDPIHARSPYLTEDWGENVHIFKSEAIECVHLPSCDIYGAAYVREDVEPLRGFHVEDESRLNLMLLHSGGSYNPISPEQIAATGLDYLALGHVHARQEQLCGKTLAAYPGCLMGRGFDECGQKGVLRVRAGKQACQTEFVPIPTRKYEILQVEAGESPLASVLNALPQGCETDCLRILLQGESNGVDVKALEAALQDRCFCVSVRDHTVPKRELWQGSEEDTLRGEVLRELKSRYETADEADARRIVRAARLLSDLMDGREADL